MTHEEEAHRSRPAARGHQQGLGAGEVDPPRAPEHAAPVVGAAAAGGGAGGDLRADGGRPVGVDPGPLFPTARRRRRRERPAAFRDHRGPGAVGEHHQRDGAAGGARRDLAELAARLRRERRPSAGQGAVRPPQAARLPRPLRRRRGAAAGGAAAGAGELRQRPEPGGGADQQGDDRDPAEVRGQAAGEPRGAQGEGAHRPGVEGRAGPGRGRALLRPVDARRGREAHRPPLPEGRGHGRDGEGAAGPEAVRRARSSP